MPITTYELTVALAGLGGMPRPGVRVSVGVIAGPGPERAGSPTQTVLPEPLVRYTDDDGVAVFSLIPSDAAGDYRVRIFSGGVIETKEFTMPQRDARLSELAAVEGGTLSWATDANFADAETSLDTTITIPTFAGNSIQYLAVPTERPDPTFISQSGTGYNQIDAFQKGAAGTLGGEAVTFWQSKSEWFGAIVSGSVWDVR